MTTRTKNRSASVKRGILRFYSLLNERDFSRCFRMIDPRIRRNSASVTLLQYKTALDQFLNCFGQVQVLDITVELHLDEPSKLYEDRDFAIGQTTWKDRFGEQHVFQERWVFVGRFWYTRSTGFVTPSSVPKRIAPAGAKAHPKRV